MLTGCPVAKLRMKLVCHRSMTRASQPELLAKRSLFGPIGSSNVPLVRRLCKGSEPRILSKSRCNGSVYATAPVEPASASPAPPPGPSCMDSVSYTHLRAHETPEHLV